MPAYHLLWQWVLVALPTVHVCVCVHERHTALAAVAGSAKHLPATQVSGAIGEALVLDCLFNGGWILT